MITRDYEYEFFMMLDRRDLDGAKRVLHDLKAMFDECSNNMPEKQQLKSLLLDLYEKFKDHLDAQNTFVRIDAQLGESTQSPQGGPASKQGRSAPIEQNDADTAHNTSKTSPMTNDTVVTPVPAPEFSALKATPATPLADNPPSLSAPTQTTPSERASKEERIAAYLDMIDTLLAKNSAMDAVNAYREAKRIALELDALQERTIKRFIAAHAAILGSVPIRTPPPAPKDAENETRTAAKTTTTSTTSNAPPTTPRTQDNDKEILIALEREKRALDECLEGCDIANAMRNYKRMRLLAQQLQSKTNAERVAMKLASLHQIIAQMKAHTMSGGADKTEKTLTEGRP